MVLQCCNQPCFLIFGQTNNALYGLYQKLQMPTTPGVKWTKKGATFKKPQSEQMHLDVLQMCSQHLFYLPWCRNYCKNQILAGVYHKYEKCFRFAKTFGTTTNCRKDVKHLEGSIRWYQNTICKRARLRWRFPEIHPFFKITVIIRSC